MNVLEEELRIRSNSVMASDVFLIGTCIEKYGILDGEDASLIWQSGSIMRNIMLLPLPLGPIIMVCPGCRTW